MLWCGTVENLHKFIDEINTINPAIQFTLSHTILTDDMNNASSNCPCDMTTSLAFLDTSLSIKNGKVEVDLYRKPTDRNHYLLTSSCHPAHVTNNIPFSLALRIVRICTDPTARDARLEELKNLLLSRNYKTSIINVSIDKARKIPRIEALKKVEKEKNSKRPVFVVLYDPRLPSITSIVRKHWRSMISQDPQLKETFPQAPLVAYKVAPNLRAKLIRAKVPEKASARPQRKLPGMKKCGKQSCAVCPYIQHGKSFKATATNYTVDFNSQLDCDTRNLVYAITCSVANCRKQYIGQTNRSLRERLKEHLGYVDRHTDATGRHFNMPGHSKSDMLVTVLEKIHSRDVWVRE